MDTFKKSLDNKIIKSLSNNYGIENYDEYRFGKITSPFKRSFLSSFKRLIKKIIRYYPELESYTNKKDELIAPFAKELENIWNNINDVDKNLLISILSYRVLGFRKVKLPRNNKEYIKCRKISRKLSNHQDRYDPNFMHFMLYKFDLNPIGYDIKFYFSESGVAIDFLIEQYVYKFKNEEIVSSKPGDVVLDIGGCWGDTALYFAHKVGVNGKVYSFEFIPGNLKIFDINTKMNPHLLSNIELVPNPVSNKSNEVVYYKDHGPGSKVQFEPFVDQTGTSKTVSIDDFVKNKKLDQVDFIKMDIEGAEPIALEGAIETIKKFKPKLAIAIYHSMSDFATIPNWILNLNLGYEIFIGHYTIHAEETVCFAQVKNNR